MHGFCPAYRYGRTVAALAVILASSCHRADPPEIPARIVESSMVPAFLGDHVRTRCTDCGGQYAVELPQSTNNQTRCVCPRCSHTHDVQSTTRYRGDAVAIRPWRHARQLRRWQPIVYQEPNSDRLCIKRLVGLPGELVEIRHGDVYIDGQIATKSMPQFRRMAITVSDSRGGRPFHLGRCWKIVSPGWSTDSQRLSWKAPAGELFPAAELQFVGRPVIGYRRTQALILDDYAFNRHLSRSLNTVADVILSCDVARPSDGVLILVAEWGRDAWRLECNLATHQARLYRGNAVNLSLSPIEALRRVPHPTHRIEFGRCDGDLTVAINGETLARHPFSGHAALSRLSVVAKPTTATSQLVLTRIGVRRDIYYVPSDRTPEPVQLDADQVFVLGDNSPRSHDSRRYGPLRLATIRGAVVRRTD